MRSIFYCSSTELGKMVLKIYLKCKKNYIKNIYYSLRIYLFALNSNCFSNIASSMDLLFGRKIMST